MAETPVETANEDQVLSSNSKNLIEDLYIGTAESTYLKSPVVPDSYMMPYNTDDLYRKTGDYTIYEEMLQDDQVSVCMSLKKDLILGSGFVIEPLDESQIEICKELEEEIEESSDMPFLDKIREIMDAYDKGFSITEKVFKIEDDGKLCLSKLLTRHPNSFKIYQDDKGNITKFEQSTSMGDIKVDPKSIIHYINNGQYQNPYGLSDLRSAYNAWFTKRQVIRYFSIFLEGMAKPIPVAKYDKNSPKGTAQSILDLIKKFHAKTALVFPKEIEMQFLEAKSNGEAYHKAIGIFNMFIGRSLFIPDLLGFSGNETGGGSYSLGKEQMNIFFQHINRRRATLEKIIQRHIIRPICLYNYGDIPVPKFKFKPLDDDKAVELAKTWLELIKLNKYKISQEEINHFQKLVKFPESEDVELVEAEPYNPLSPFGDKKPMDDKEDNDSKDLQDKKDEKKFAKVYDFPSGDYHKKVDFKAIENKLNDYDTSVINDAQPVLKKIFTDLYDQLQKKNITQNQNLEKLDSVKLRYKSELKKILKNSFMGIYRDGMSQAQRELNKSEFALPTTSDEFLDLLEAESFGFIGDWEYNILKKTKAELVAAIKDGRPLSTVIDVLDNEGKKLSEVSLERFARTKHTEVLNRGRHEFFEQSGVVAGYQYSAILDDGTSEICRGLHGKKFKAGTEPVPPSHWNCRSILIPITKYEEFEASETVGKVPIQEFIKENIGSGFSIK